jgi:serine/threonine protein kinase
MRMPKTDPELVYLDPQKLARLLVNAGLSDHQFKDRLESHLSRNTVGKILAGAGVRRDGAKVVADFFDTDVLSLLSPRDRLYVPPIQTPNGVPWEWERESVLDPGGRRAANGLHYFICRMKHRHTPGLHGRGKFYLLSGLPSAVREQKREQLRRHAEVCSRISPHPHLAENLSSTPIEAHEGWWVVDRWVESRQLSEQLGGVPLSSERLARLMKDLASALSALHRAGVVMRELAPSRVLIATADGRALLTDFELAKLLSGSPTVSPDEPWPEDPYRAPEVDSGTVSPAADLYSWARILVHAACGVLPSPGRDVSALDQLHLPKSVWGTTRRCLAIDPAERPQHTEDVLQAIQKWT